MSREWKPGDVAVLTWDNGSGDDKACGRRRRKTRVGLRYADGWIFDTIARLTDVQLLDEDDLQAEIRPLVIIDPEDREQVARLSSALTVAAHWTGVCEPQRTSALAGALRSLIEPPKPEEPTGLGAAVEATAYTDKLRLFVRIGSDESPWMDSEGNGHDWDELDVERVLAEGVQP